MNDRELLIRDCHTGVRYIRRLVLTLQDELGDLTIGRTFPGETVTEELAQACDKLIEYEAWLHKLQGRLWDISVRKP